MPRVALLTQRGGTSGSALLPAYGAWPEAEDILLNTVDADVVRLDLAIEHPRIRFRRKAGNTVRRATGKHVTIPAFGSPTRALRSLQGRYDIAIFVAFSIWDLPLLERLGPLHRFADQTAVWFFETWPSSYTCGKVAYEPFSTVDHIFVGLERAVEPLSETIGRPVTYLPMASDTPRFCPHSSDSDRPIDLIGIGRRRHEQHEQMLNWARHRERFYLYDSTRVDRPNPDHRDNLGRWYSSAKLSTCNYAKSDRADIVGPNRVIPGRLWEGLAAGCALFGIPPDPEVQRGLFGRTVVEPVPDAPQDLPEFLEAQIASHGPSQIAANVHLALTGHDWAHRWVAMLAHLDLPIPELLLARIAELTSTAEKFAVDRSDVPAGPPPGGYVVPGTTARLGDKPLSHR